MNSVYFTTYLSIIIQTLTGIIGINGLFINLPEENKILQHILALEMGVQFTELFFYIFVLQSMVMNALPQMAAMRYLDWVITTPTMLLTSIIFFKYEEYLENNINQKLDFWDFIKTHKGDIITIFVCNFLMLFFGYLGEIEVIDIKLSITLGFLFFGMTFYIIYNNYAVKSKNARKLYYFLITVWGLYGIAAIMSPHTKNNMYNILDLFAKNFFGIYLYYRIVTLNNEKKEKEKLLI
jgi:bacteriorhodopsin